MQINMVVEFPLKRNRFVNLTQQLPNSRNITFFLIRKSSGIDEKSPGDLASVSFSLSHSNYARKARTRFGHVGWHVQISHVGFQRELFSFLGFSSYTSRICPFDVPRKFRFSCQRHSVVDTIALYVLYEIFSSTNTFADRIVLEPREKISEFNDEVKYAAILNCSYGYVRFHNE